MHRILFLLFLTFGIATAADDKTPPDLTQDNAVDRKLTYNLGATGMRGWMAQP